MRGGGVLSEELEKSRETDMIRILKLLTAVSLQANQWINYFFIDASRPRNSKNGYLITPRKWSKNVVVHGQKAAAWIYISPDSFTQDTIGEHIHGKPVCDTLCKPTEFMIVKKWNRGCKMRMDRPDIHVQIDNTIRTSEISLTLSA